MSSDMIDQTQDEFEPFQMEMQPFEPPSKGFFGDLETLAF